MAAGDQDRLRLAARAAADGGLTGSKVQEAWEWLRVLESRAWLRRQLGAALAGGDPAKLQAAIRQAEVAGLGGHAEVVAARAELADRTARLSARQELHLSRKSGNFYQLLAAVRAAERAGLPPEELLAEERRSLEECGLGTDPETQPTRLALPGPHTDQRLHPPTAAQLPSPPTNPRLHPPTDAQLSAPLTDLQPPPTDPRLHLPTSARLPPPPLGREPPPATDPWPQPPAAATPPASAQARFLGLAAWMDALGWSPRVRKKATDQSAVELWPHAPPDASPTSDAGGRHPVRVTFAGR